MLPIPPPSAAIWDEEHIKALFGLRRYPTHLVYVEPWHTWLKERGGIKQVVAHLSSLPLGNSQRQLLDLLLTHPEASTLFYAGKLHLAHSKYFVHLKNLLQVFSAELNNWTIEQPQDGHTPPPQTNLPVPITPLIGAGESVATVVAMLKQPGMRLLTLTGPGGVGKTRLAIAAGVELMSDFCDGVFFVALETITDEALLITQIARALNLETIGGQSLLDVLKTHLRKQQTLLILDNFEQLVQCAGVTTDLLQAAGQLKILVTSREALNVYGESLYIVPELPRPDPESLPAPDQLSRWPALDLFVQRVQARHPKFIATEANLESITRICNRLDGLPLAIELAAAQVRLLSSDQTLPQLEHGLKTLRDPSRDRPSRQRTLWNAIDWSYQLLTEPEQMIFRNLAVFGREWGLNAARSVCGVDDLLNSLGDLVDKSLLRYVGQDEDGDSRFQMLQPMREFAFERLAESSETQQAQRHHAAYFLKMVEHAEPSIGGPQQLVWMRRIKQERENLQIALQWMLGHEETEMAFRLLGAAWRYYNMLNIWDETETWMSRALTQDTQSKSAARVKTLWGAYWLAARHDDHEKGWVLAQEGLRLAREQKDQRLIGLLLQSMFGELFFREQYEDAMQAIEESVQIFRELGDKEEVAWALGHRSILFSRRGELAKGLEILQESLSIFRSIGNDWAVEQVLRDLAFLLLQEGELTQVKNVLEESLQISEKIGKRMGIGSTLNLQGRLALRLSDFKLARKLFEEAQVIFTKLGDQQSLFSNDECLKELEERETNERS